jgi:trehalose 6-phosphate phosphatase
MQPNNSYVALPPPCPDWAYFLDVDGTLINHTSNIEALRIAAETIRIVEDLIGHCDGAFALVSGRRLEDLQRMFAIEGVPLIGQNGLEGCDSKGQTWRKRGFKPEIQHRIKARLKSLLRIYPQLHLEDKGLMITLHCRSMSMPYFQKALLPLISRLVEQCNKESEQVTLELGKTGLDLMPPDIGKGHAVSWLLTQPPFSGRVPIFIGDDWADESAFREVNRRNGHSIKVGAGRTYARHQFQDVAQVLTWLSTVSDRK